MGSVGRAGPAAGRLAFVTGWMCLAGGCGGILDSLGATGSVRRADVLPSGATIQLTYQRTHDPIQAADVARLVAAARGVDLAGGELITPEGEHIPLAPGDEDGLVEAAVEGGEAEILARFPNGRYTFALETTAGVHLSATALVLGSFPAFPDVLLPLDEDEQVAVDTRVRWSGEPLPHDVVLVEEVSGERTALALRTIALEVQPRQPLRPDTDYRLEVTARSGLPLALAEYESLSVIRFTTEGEAQP